MQQHQQGRHFADNPPSQPVYRFQQNQPQHGWQPQERFSNEGFQNIDEPVPHNKKHSTKPLHRHRKLFTWWNLFAVIGIITVIIQCLRYIIIPFLVYLNTVSGGVL